MKNVFRFIPIIVSFIALFVAMQPGEARGRPLGDYSNFDGLIVEGTFGTATPQIVVKPTGGNVAFEVQNSGGTPVYQIDSAGGIPSGIPSGGLTITSGGLTVSAGLSTFSGGVNCTPQTETVTATFVITPTSCLVSMTSNAEYTSSTTTGIITTTATDGDIVILQNNNPSAALNIDGTGGSIECKANVALGAGDTLGVLYNGTDEVWNCLFNYDNS